MRLRLRITRIKTSHRWSWVKIKYVQSGPWVRKLFTTQSCSCLGSSVEIIKKPGIGFFKIWAPLGPQSPSITGSRSVVVDLIHIYNTQVALGKYIHIYTMVGQVYVQFCT